MPRPPSPRRRRRATPSDRSQPRVRAGEHLDPHPDDHLAAHRDPRNAGPSGTRPLPPPLRSGIRPGPPPVAGWPDERPLPRLPRVPVANLDPIRSSADALALLSAVVRTPLCHETVVVLLDARRCGDTIVAVDDTEHADPCLVLERICEAVTGSGVRAPVSAVVMASVRPGGTTRPGDVDTWLEASALTETFGIDLVEWFVVGPSGVECPRDLLGEPERW